MTTNVTTDLRYIHNPNHDRTPRSDNGEDVVASVLEYLNIWHEYETIAYPFLMDSGKIEVGFEPDFPLFEALGIPVCNLEVTWPDHPWQSDAKRAERCKAVFQAKQCKIMTTWKTYGIPTLLITYQATIALANRPHILLGLLATIHDEGGEQGLYCPTHQDLLPRRVWRK